MPAKFCQIHWRSRTDGSGIVDICAVDSFGNILFSLSYNAQFASPEHSEAQFTGVYNWTIENGYTIHQGEATLSEGQRVRFAWSNDPLGKITKILTASEDSRIRVLHEDGIGAGKEFWYDRQEIKPYTDSAQSSDSKSLVTPSLDSITLSENEIDWLGHQYVPMSNDFRAYVFSQEVKSAPRCVVQLGETKSGMIRFQLVPEKRTDANMAAIEKHRKELLGE